jgi:Domain of unknown function (DUF4440)
VGRVMVLSGLLAFAALWGVPSHAADAALRSVLEGRYAAMKTAIATRNEAAIKAVFGPDFMSLDASGHEGDTATMLRQLAAMPADPNRVSKTTILSVKQDSVGAHVEQRYDMTTTKTAADGTTQHIELVTLSADIWVKIGGTWLLQQTTARQADYFIDGKSVMHQVNGTTP